MWQMLQSLSLKIVNGLQNGKWLSTWKQVIQLAPNIPNDYFMMDTQNDLHLIQDEDQDKILSVIFGNKLNFDKQHEFLN